MPRTAISDLPLELLEHVLLISDPLDVASAAQAARLFRDLVYDTRDEHFWRALYLAQAFDDPRSAVTYLGSPRTNIDWKGELQRIIRARTVFNNLSLCRPEERCTVIQTLLDMISNVPPIPFPDSPLQSRNVYWVTTLLRDGAFLDHDLWVLSNEERQLRARLHAWFGLTQRDGRPDKRVESRAYVYSLRNYRQSNAYGPFLKDGSGRVNWVHMQALQHVFAMVLIDVGEGEDVAFEICPMSLSFCQSIIPPGLNLDRESDWAGVEGLWRISYCFIDHRELLIYNDFNLSDDEPLDATIFEDPDIEETYASVDIFFRVIDVEHDPDHPTRPKINYIGELDGNFSIVGHVRLTPDNQVCWHFVAGNGDQPVWSADAIHMGNVRSQYGILGAWSTVFHDAQDPVGPFWMQRQYPIEE
ncbi:hypothetical protein BV22DRAFT_1035027 [Leucogyrophana mollusca]|uniref:Uncharacterized protein n=1 Tax=Leucogyrophana mollusca TaxID=85980 RepID=A0ACB8BFH8_9AGAM|nr:hypothetical protein BV22DRAFT_1035027 [Leucogyrophana mollusca]